MKSKKYQIIAVEILTDQIIGAAQALEASAKRLREDATAIRRNGLFADTPEMTAVDLMRMHKVSDVKRAAEHALREFGVLSDNGYLIERTM